MFCLNEQPRNTSCNISQGIEISKEAKNGKEKIGKLISELPEALLLGVIRLENTTDFSSASHAVGAHQAFLSIF